MLVFHSFYTSLEYLLTKIYAASDISKDLLFMNVADHARTLNTVRKKTAHFFTIRKARFIKGGGLVIKK